MRSFPPWLLGELSEPRLTLWRTKQLHAKLIRLFLSTNPFCATRILRFYAINGRLRSARRLFDLCPRRSVFLWNAIIRAHAKEGQFAQSFSLFASMVRAATAPDEYTFACLLRAAAESFDLWMGRLVHGMMVVGGVWRSSISGAALVVAYSRLGLVGDARLVFDRMRLQDLVSWNAMLSGYGGDNCWFECFECFGQMRKLGVRPDGYSMVALLSSICGSNLLAVGSGLHGVCVKGGFDSGAHVVSALVSMYSRCHDLALAHQVFSEFAHPDLIMWSALITGFSQQSGECGNALKLFSKMNEVSEMTPDHVLLAIVIAACAQLAAVEPGKELHAYAIRHSMETKAGVSSALTDMYSKSGFIRLSLHVFGNMPEKNLVAYNAAISGLGIHGLANEAIRLFEEMLQKGFKPDSSTFSALLCACCHGRLANEGKELFERMENIYGVTPDMEHYVYMVKLLVSVGDLEDARNLILAMPIIPDSGVWGALLSGCCIHENSRLSEIVACRLFHIDPQKPAYKVMLSNIYAAEGRWNDVSNLRGAMLGGGLRKPTGISMVVHSTT